MTQTFDQVNNANQSPWALTLAEASRRLAAGELSPVALLDAVLERIEATDSRIHTYLHLATEQARAAAIQAEADIRNGGWKGPLHGLPFAVKDNYDAAGMPATAGSRLRLNRIPERDAALVAQLRNQGAILAGKLSTWEFGTGNGAEYFDLPFPPARNPWDTERFTGGSSTGSGAAVAAGNALFALGSDTTGSVRLPAAATGTVGMIPTAGRLSLEGILPNCGSLDRPGVFTWTVEDCAIVLDALIDGGEGGQPANASLRRATNLPIEGLRIAVVDSSASGFPAPDPRLLSGFEQALAVLERLGARLTPVRLPVPAAECFAATRMIGPAESAAIHATAYAEKASLMGQALRAKLESGALVRAVDYLAAQQLRCSVAASLDALIRGFDALVTFGTLQLPPRLGVEPEMTAFTVETMLTPFNLSGHPALVQCTGFADGLPLHWQLVGNHKDEASILKVAAAYEAATPWRNRRPPL